MSFHSAWSVLYCIRHNWHSRSNLPHARVRSQTVSKTLSLARTQIGKVRQYQARWLPHQAFHDRVRQSAPSQNMPDLRNSASNSPPNNDGITYECHSGKKQVGIKWHLETRRKIRSMGKTKHGQNKAWFQEPKGRGPKLKAIKTAPMFPRSAARVLFQHCRIHSHLITCITSGESILLFDPIHPCA